jgi:hypothetical protein
LKQYQKLTSKTLAWPRRKNDKMTKKRTKKLTRAEKKQKYGTVESFLKSKKQKSLKTKKQKTKGEK